MRSDQRISTWAALYLPISDGKRNIQQLQDYALFGSLRAARGEVVNSRSVARTTAPVEASELSLPKSPFSLKSLHLPYRDQ